MQTTTRDRQTSSFVPLYEETNERRETADERTSAAAAAAARSQRPKVADKTIERQERRTTLFLSCMHSVLLLLPSHPVLQCVKKVKKKIRRPKTRWSACRWARALLRFFWALFQDNFFVVFFFFFLHRSSSGSSGSGADKNTPHRSSPLINRIHSVILPELNIHFFWVEIYSQNNK